VPHGVFRRQFFQVVERDLKKALVVPMLAAPLPLVAFGDAPQEAILTLGTPTRMQGLRNVSTVMDCLMLRSSRRRSVCFWACEQFDGHTTWLLLSTQAALGD